jgi:hypothetical protein
MNKIIKLSESDLINIVKKVLTEQVNNNINPKNLKFGDGGRRNPNQIKDVKELQQKLGFSKPTGYFGKNTKAALDKALGKPTGNYAQFNPNIIGKDKTRVAEPISNLKTDTLVSKSTNPSFIKLISPKKINTSSSTPIFPAGQDFCSQFVNDFSDKFGYVGDAWIAHNNDKLGNRVFSSFTSLSPEQSKQAIDLWTKINKNGGGKEKGPFTNTVKQFVNQLVPSTPPMKLNLDDIVGIYYPKSGYHEKAFYEAGIPYFTEGPNKNMVPGNTIKSGKGWGMNTHLGIVGAIKNGVPIIFHNIHGQVYADPVGSLKDGGRVAWVRSLGGQAVSLNDKPSKSLEV